MDSEQRVYEHAITLTYLKVYLNSLNISNKFHIISLLDKSREIQTHVISSVTRVTDEGFSER